MALIALARGDIVLADLRGAEGTEKQGIRPCLVIQNDIGNAHSPLTIVAPITDVRQHKRLPIQVPVSATDMGPGGVDSVVELGHIRAIDRDVRIIRKLGSAPAAVMKRVDAAILTSLGV